MHQNLTTVVTTPLIIVCMLQHMFHNDCAEQWLRQKHSCPLCRYELEQESSGSNSTYQPAATSQPSSRQQPRQENQSSSSQSGSYPLQPSQGQQRGGPAPYFLQDSAGMPVYAGSAVGRTGSAATNAYLNSRPPTRARANSEGRFCSIQ